MSKPWVTLCIPSRRSLVESRPSLDAAISYAIERNYRVVISDNSGDEAKETQFSGCSEHVHYLGRGPADGGANMLNALSMAETEFILPVGDDDLVFAKAGLTAFDFAALDPEFVAVKPVIEVFSQANGLLRRNEFSILADMPGARMQEYAKSIGGDNSSYYSFYRRDAFTAVFQLFVEKHPTGAASTDWPIVYSLMAAGKCVVDRATCYRYNIGQWEFAESIKSAEIGIIKQAGLPAEAARYANLFHFLDAHCYLSGLKMALTQAQQMDASQAAALIFLRDLLRQAYRDPDSFPCCRPFMAALVGALSMQRLDLPRIFFLACDVAEMLKPGLKKGYEAFLAAARQDGADLERGMKR